LQQNKPDDYVLATGVSTTVREFINLAFKEIGFAIEWRGHGINETGLCSKTGQTLVRVDPRYFRPTEVDMLEGDASKAYRDFGWKPATTLKEMIVEMVQHDIKMMSERVPSP
jgi:GDPmannose 4,6-dehydratase